MYSLMNKNKRLLDFTIEGEGILESCHIVKQYDNLPE